MEQLCRKLKDQGVDTESVIARLGGNEQLYLSICKKFLNDSSYPSAKKALAAGKLKEVQVHIHTLKGVSANLGFNPISYLCKRLLTDLEQYELNKFDQDISILTKEYDKIISLLSRS